MAHPVDEHVGACVKAVRKTKGMSQEALASQVGVSFQQLQKYERGVNRVSSSKLFEIAEALGVEIAVFFEGLGTSAAQAQGSLMQRLAGDEQLQRLVGLYERISTDGEKRRLVQVMETLVGA